MDNKNMSTRWAHFDTERFVEAAIKGPGDRELIQEAKDLMEATIASRDEE